MYHRALSFRSLARIFLTPPPTCLRPKEKAPSAMSSQSFSFRLTELRSRHTSKSWRFSWLTVSWTLTQKSATSWSKIERDDQWSVVIRFCSFPKEKQRRNSKRSHRALASMQPEHDGIYRFIDLEICLVNASSAQSACWTGGTISSTACSSQLKRPRAFFRILVRLTGWETQEYALNMLLVRSRGHERNHRLHVENSPQPNHQRSPQVNFVSRHALHGNIWAVPRIGRWQRGGSHSRSDNGLSLSRHRNRRINFPYWQCDRLLASAVNNEARDDLARARACTWITGKNK